jgi:hypothetical protein
MSTTSRHFVRLREVVLTVVVIAVAYPLSFGPVLRICGASSSTGIAALPRPVRVAYAPLTALPGGWITDVLDHYVQFWIGTE